MTVYVDKDIHQWRGKKWCHLFVNERAGDPLAELHHFASKLGLKREWFQSKDQGAAFNHYDIVSLFREKAIRLGAVAVDNWRLLEIVHGAEYTKRVRGQIDGAQAEIVKAFAAPGIVESVAIRSPSMPGRTAAVREQYEIAYPPKAAGDSY